VLGAVIVAALSPLAAWAWWKAFKAS
jgi:hypothetical protein